MKAAISIYTDGACQGNPGPGGWAYLLRCGQHEKLASGHAPLTTNNRMELQAVIEALKALNRPCVICLYTDSQYVKKGATEWLPAWKKNNWKTADKKPVKNQDLWEILAELVLSHQIDWHWVRGHNGHPENERVDEAARQACTDKSS